MPQTIVDRLRSEFQEIVALLGEGEISLRLTAEENFRKSLLLAAASYFEISVTETLRQLVADGNPLVREFFQNKAIARQYHTYFTWDAKNANTFFGLFGTEFKAYMMHRVSEDNAIGDAIKAFLEIGNERNRLVHQNYGTYALEKNSAELYALYLRASPFVEQLGSFMGAFIDHLNEAEDQDSDQ